MAHTVIFQARIAYQVDVKSPVAASKKAYLELIEAFPCIGDQSDDGKVVCIDLQLDQVLPMKEVDENS